MFNREKQADSLPNRVAEIVGHCPHCGYGIEWKDLNAWRWQPEVYGDLPTEHFCPGCQQPFVNLAEDHESGYAASVPARVTLVNLTPHPIVFDLNGQRLTFQSVQPTVRVRTVREVRPDLWLDDVNSVPLYSSRLGEAENLPARVAGVVYIVSLVALTAIKEQYPGRHDFVAPGTGPDDGAIRYMEGPRKGLVEAVTCFIC